jgi:SAM-dependent methyltransferase
MVTDHDSRTRDGDKIEILSVALLDRHRERVERLRRLSRSLALPLGWHYLLDLAWILDQLGEPRGKKIVDAGAGIGVLQWLLAEAGADVISVDRRSRARLPLHFRHRFRTRGLRTEDLAPEWRAFTNAKGIVRSALSLVRGGATKRSPAGTVTIYNQDLARLADIADSSVDAVVSVSALEHNDAAALRTVVIELLRVLKPGGLLIATLGAARGRDWLHEPSAGWCYTEETLRDVFQIAAGAPSNYDRHDELMAMLANNDELRRGLAPRYRISGNNGMPWGRWDPTYQPVGVVKVKP